MEENSAAPKAKTPNLEKLQEKHKKQTDKLLAEVAKVQKNVDEIYDILDKAQAEDGSGQPVRALKSIRARVDRITKVCDRVLPG